jgi:hypothetical protein
MSNFKFEWYGDKTEREVMELVDQHLIRLGGFLVDHMQALAPVGETGNLRNSIADHYDVSTHTLTVYIGMNYGVYQELGTRYIPPHPFIRPSIIDAIAAGWNITDVEIILNPPVVSPSHLRATRGGFRIPKSAHLTAQQLHHVNTKLRPVSKSFSRQFKKLGTNFKITGPRRKKF